MKREYSPVVPGLTLFALLCLSPFCAKSREAMNVVERLHAAILDAAKSGETLGYRGRYDALEPVIHATHDIAFIGELTTGRYWRELEENDRATFVETFLRLSTATYASRFKSYSGESFQLLSESEQGPDSVVVKSLLSHSGGKTLRFDYALRKSDEGWLIVNILVDGVSDLALKRAEYRKVLKRGAFATLIAHLEQQISELETG